MMETNRKKIIIISVAAVVLLIGIGVFFFQLFSAPDKTGESEELENQTVSTQDPTDIVLDFYDAWLLARQSTSTDPYQLGLHENPLLSAALRAKIAAGQNRSDTEPDPVLCQPGFPEKIKLKKVFEVADKTQVLVRANDNTLTGQVEVTLLKHNDGWYISDIVCSQGDVAPVREFSFDHEGFVLKGVPPQLSADYWYLIFEEDGEPGHAAPLFFTPESMCTSTDGNEAVCTPDQFLPIAKAHVYGQMTDTGAEVKRLEFLE